MLEVSHAIDGFGLLAAGGIGPYWRFTGVFHPAVAHFPIALLIVAAVVEGWSVFRRHRKPLHTTLVCLYLGTIAAVVTTMLGWASADASGDRGPIVTLHRWLGVSVAALAIVSVILSMRANRDDARRRIIWAYRGVVFTCAGLVGLVGSYGGKLVHGATYYEDALATLRQELKEPDTALAAAISTAIPAPVAATPTTAPAENVSVDHATVASVTDHGITRVDYNRDIQPIFMAHCTKCHNDTKTKGGYRLDSADHVFAAGESGTPPIVPGKSDESQLVKVIEGKGEYADSVMPPKGDPLGLEQIALIRKWIDQGAMSSSIAQ